MALTKAQGKFSQAIDDGADATAITISSSEYVGVGTAPIVPLDVVAKTGAHAISMRARSNNDYAFFSMRSYDGTEDLGDIAIQRTAADTGRMLLYTNNGGSATTKLTIEPNGDIKANSGNIVIGTSGKGIDFGATSDASGMTSELLDDYEEGTWTPTLVPTSGSFGSITHSVQLGYYTKIGDVVTAHARVDTSSMSIGTAGGYLRVHGFPYTANGNAYQSIYVGYAWGYSTYWPSGGAMGGGTTTCYLYTNQGNANSATVVPSNLGTGQTYLYVSVSYKTT